MNNQSLNKNTIQENSIGFAEINDDMLEHGKLPGLMIHAQAFPGWKDFAALQWLKGKVVFAKSKGKSE